MEPLRSLPLLILNFCVAFIANLLSSFLLMKSKKVPREPPDEFLCPISGSLMIDPVVVSGGQTFDRVSAQVCKDLGFCPVLGTACQPDFTILIPNLALKSAIAGWCKSSGTVRAPAPDYSSVEKIVQAQMEDEGIGRSQVGAMERVLLPPLPLTESPPAEVTPSRWKHDVFLSFRGEDTRKSFAAHLFHAFRLADVNCYRDTDRDERGREVGPMLLHAIRHSRIALILFSTNFAASRWCLQELVEILRCHKSYKDQGHLVVPIFYGVDPTDVRRQSRKFGIAFDKCKADSLEERAGWKYALEEAGKLSGWHDHDREEPELIDEILEKIQSRVSYGRSSYFIRDAVGIDGKVGDVISSLDIGSDDVRVIGIHGVKEIGKTTMARLICSRVFDKFEGVSFLEVGHAKHEGLTCLQRKLLYDVLRVKHFMMDEYDIGANAKTIRSKLCKKAVLLVLDDVKEKNQVALLGGDRQCLGPGSRILITTRDEQLLNHIKVDSKFMVSGLGPAESLQFFSQHAFSSDDPKEGYREVSEKLVHYTAGFPSALKRLGISLSKEPSRDQWCKVLGKLTEKPDLNLVGSASSNDVSSPHPFQSVGPYGGLGGTPFDDEANTDVVKLKIAVAESCIGSIQIEYSRNGSVICSSGHGEAPARKVFHVYEVTLNYPTEYVISVSGHIMEELGIIQSLTIQTNERTYGPYGPKRGKHFSFPTRNGQKVVGFFGNCGLFLNSIGAHFGPISELEYPFGEIGPFGGKSRRTWNDGKHGDIRQIDVNFDSAVEAISILYDNLGHPVGPFSHGENDGCNKLSVRLNYPFEFLTSVSGYVRGDGDNVILSSLTIHSNMEKYGPFGTEVGDPFSSPSFGGKIVGFHGTCNGDFLESIGVHVEPVSHIHPVRRVGPFGDEAGGRAWDDGSGSNLKEIVIRCGPAIDSISCDYKSGLASDAPSDGRNRESELHTVKLDPDEYITQMCGYLDRKGGVSVIRSLQFQSNKAVYGPFGSGKGTYFLSPPDIGKLVGFYGSSSQYLNCIGAYFEPIHHIDPAKVVGPFGGANGVSWDDGRRGNLRRINLRYGVVIDSISCVYDDGKGRPVQAPTHGGQGGDAVTIQLDYSDEYIISMSGSVGRYGQNLLVVTSLTFRSNKGTYGPFGNAAGRQFSFTTNIGKITGFFGRSGRLLDSIGAYIELFSC